MLINAYFTYVKKDNKNKHSFCKFSASWPLLSKKQNDKNVNLCKIHGALYIASALIMQKECLFLLHYHVPMEDSSES